MDTQETPSYVLYSDLKSFGHVSNKDAANILLSDMRYGEEPIRVRATNERTFLHRLVHAEPGKVMPEFYGDFIQSARKLETLILSNLGGGDQARQDFLEHYRGPASERMAKSIMQSGGDGNLYLNALKKIALADEISDNMQGQLCFMLFLISGCTGDPQEAMNAVDDYTCKVMSHGLYTTETSVGPGYRKAATKQEDVRLGLLRVIDKSAVLPALPLTLDPEGTIIGALAEGPHAITSVGYDVSRRHARIWREDGIWWVEGLGSTNGTTVIRGDTHETVVVEPPKAARQPGVTYKPVKLLYDDFLCLGTTTQFLVLKLAAPDGEQQES